MSYLQFLLVLHVLGAIVGLGSTFAFAFFPAQGDELEPGVRARLADISYRLSSRMTAPVAFVTQPVTGVLMIFETGRNRGFFEHEWLWIAVALYLTLIAIVAFFLFPDSRHEYEVHALGRAEEPGYRPRGNTSVLGPLTGVIIIVIAVLMVWKPGD